MKNTLKTIAKTFLVTLVLFCTIDVLLAKNSLIDWNFNLLFAAILCVFAGIVEYSTEQ